MAKSSNKRSEDLRFGIVTAATGSTQKRILYKDEKAVKDPNHNLGIHSGTFQNYRVSGLQGFKQTIEALEPNQALTTGTAARDHVYTLETDKAYSRRLDRLSVLAEHDTINGVGVAEYKSQFISRTKKHITEPTGVGLILFDHDPAPGQQDLDGAAFWVELCRVAPALSPLSNLQTTSSSSGIHHKETGECLQPEAGHHTFILVTGDRARLVEYLTVMSWANGAGRYDLATQNKATGVAAKLERHIIDMAVFSAERLVYESGACFEPDSPLEQRRTPPRLHEGTIEVLDCDNLPELTEEVRALAKFNKEAAYAAVGGRQLKKTIRHIEATQPKGFYPSTEKEAKKRIKAQAAGQLAADHILYCIDGREIKVADITVEHDGLLFSDPQEPTYDGGSQKAKLYWNNGPWRIHSHAHGGVVYSPANSTGNNKARSLADQWEMIPEGVDWLYTRYFGPALLDRIKAADMERYLLGVFGATGTGKTHALKVVRQYAKLTGRQFIYLTVKETLARAAGRDLGLEYRLDLEGAGTQTAYPNLAGCAASLIENARGINWETQVSSNAIVVIDEADLFASVATGASAGSNALELQRVLRRILQRAQTVVILSAQLKSRHQALIERVGWFRRSEMIGILKAATPKHITICDDTAQKDPDAEVEGDESDSGQSVAPLKNWLIDELAQHLQADKNALVLTGSQKPDSKLGTMLLEPFALEECGARSVLRLDSQSIKDPTNPGFKIADKDYVAAMRAVQLVVASPSCQEGFSLKFGEGADDSHFDKVFCFDPGSKLPEQLIQDVGRDRHATPTFISVAPGHTQKKFGGTVEPLEIRRQLEAIANQKETRLLSAAQFGNALNWDSEFIAFYCEDVAQANAAIADKVYNLRRYFEAVGHTVAVMQPSPKLDGVGIPEEFYENIALTKYHRPVSDAPRIDKFTAEEWQKKGEVTLEQWYSVQQLQLRQSLRWDVTHTYNAETDTIESPETPDDNGLVLDPAFVRQWSRDRIAKPWQMHYYAQQNEWDWFAHDFKKTRFNPKHEVYKEVSEGNVSIKEDFSPGDILGLKSRRLSILKELGIIDFLNQRSVAVASDRIASAETAQDLTNAIHTAHRDARFTKRDLTPIVEKLAPRFEPICELLGVKSQRNNDGVVDHRQVLTILRNVFQVKTFKVSDARLNGERGTWVLVADDKAQALRKGLYKADKAGDERKLQYIDAARDAYQEAHNRTELQHVWDQHSAVERKQLRDFLKEQPYKVGVLDRERPEHWQSLAGYAQQQANAEQVPTAFVKAPHVEPVATVPEELRALPNLTADASAEWLSFEQGLINAESFAELLHVKNSVSKAFRVGVMSAWESDGRYSWLEKKAAWLQLATA